MNRWITNVMSYTFLVRNENVWKRINYSSINGNDYDSINKLLCKKIPQDRKKLRGFVKLLQINSEQPIWKLHF